LHTPPLHLYPYCFFSILRPQPRSTLFPYTTLFRSDQAEKCRGVLLAEHRRLRTDEEDVEVGLVLRANREPAEPVHGRGWPEGPRSEEHTSELQSRSDLVCRLLLEKKKSYIIIPNEL